MTYPKSNKTCLEMFALTVPMKQRTLFGHCLMCHIVYVLKNCTKECNNNSYGKNINDV